MCNIMTMMDLVMCDFNACGAQRAQYLYERDSIGFLHFPCLLVWKEEGKIFKTRKNATNFKINQNYYYSFFEISPFASSFPLPRHGLCRRLHETNNNKN